MANTPKIITPRIAISQAEYLNLPAKIYQYMPITGKLPGMSFEEQTEDFLNDLSGRVWECEKTAEIAKEALAKADQALEEVGALRTDLTVLTKRVDGHDADIQLIQTDIANIEKKDQEQDDRLDALEARDAKWQEQLDDHERRIKTLEVNNETQDARIDTIEGTLEQIDTELDKKLNTDLSNVAADAKLPIANGGTGASTAAEAITNLGIDTRLIPEGGTAGQVVTKTESGVGWGDVSEGGIPDAPVDGKTYGRKDAAWTEVSTLEDAPTDGKTYGRKDSAWAEVPVFEDAPSDGEQYARMDGAWSKLDLLELSDDINCTSHTMAISCAVMQEVLAIAKEALAKSGGAIVLSAPTVAVVSSPMYAGVEGTWSITKGEYEICPVVAGEVNVYRKASGSTSSPVLKETVSVIWNNNAASQDFKYTPGDGWEVGDEIFIEARLQDDLTNWSAWSEQVSTVLESNLTWDRLFLATQTGSLVPNGKYMNETGASGQYKIELTHAPSGFRPRHLQRKVFKNVMVADGNVIGGTTTNPTTQQNLPIFSRNGVYWNYVDKLPVEDSNNRYAVTTWVTEYHKGKWYAVSCFGDVCVSEDGKTFTALENTRVDMTALGKAGSSFHADAAPAWSQRQYARMLSNDKDLIILAYTQYSATPSGLESSMTQRAMINRSSDNGLTWGGWQQLSTTEKITCEWGVTIREGDFIAISQGSILSGGKTGFLYTWDFGKNWFIDTTSISLTSDNTPFKTPKLTEVACADTNSSYRYAYNWHFIKLDDGISFGWYAYWSRLISDVYADEGTPMIATGLYKVTLPTESSPVPVFVEVAQIKIPIKQATTTEHKKPQVQILNSANPGMGELKYFGLIVSGVTAMTESGMYYGEYFPEIGSHNLQLTGVMGAFTEGVASADSCVGSVMYGMDFAMPNAGETPPAGEY